MTDNLNETQVLSLEDLKNSQKNSGNYFTITIIEGIDFGLIFQIDNQETIIGRKDEDDNKVDIELNDDKASRRHLMLAKRENNNIPYIVAIDLASKNGTFVNGKRIAKGETTLYNGDKLQVGNSVLKFEIKDTIDITSHQERLYQQVTRDPQTGLWNYNYAQQELEKMVSMSERNNTPFSLLILEIDFFQILNETYGRNVGDIVLRAVAQRISSELSDYETAARFSGNKFLVLLPETNMETAAKTAERLREVIEVSDFSASGCQQRVTISGGVAQFPICGRKGKDVLDQADEALYRAKQVGRNRIIKAEVTTKDSAKVTRNLLKFAVFLLLVIGVVVGITIIYPKIATKVETKPDTIFSGTIETHEVFVGSKIGGRVTEVLIKEGDYVKKGQPLAKFDIDDLLAQRDLQNARIKEIEANLEKLRNGFRPEEITQAEAAVRKEAAILEELRNGPRPQEIAQTKAELAGAEANLANAISTFKRIEQVYLKGYQSKQDKDDAENIVNIEKARVEALKNRLALLEEGTRVEQIKAAQHRYEEALANEKLFRKGTRYEDISAAQAQLEVAKAELERLNVLIKEGEILAPVDSRVEVASVRPGDVITVGRPIAVLLEDDQIWLRVYVPQTKIGLVKVGQKAFVKADSFPNKQFSAYVEKINEQAEFYPRNVQEREDRERQVFGIRVRINDPDNNLKAGMSADAVLELK